MAILTREQLLAPKKFKIEELQLSTGKVYVRQMSGLDKGQFDLTLGRWEDYIEDGEPKERWVRTMDNFRGKIAVHTLCDKDGTLLLKPEDAEEFARNTTPQDLMLIADLAQKLNNVSQVDRAKIRKN